MRFILIIMMFGVTMTPFSSSIAAETAVADLNAMLETARAKSGLPGVAAVVVKGTNIIAAGVAGLRKTGGAEKITIHDKFHIGSNTKAMTATLAAMLVEEGKLKWTTTLDEIFPELKMHPRYRAVTLEQLLTHRSGAPPSVLVPTVGTLIDQRRSCVRTITAKEPPGPIGKYEYSNAGYIMAGAMLEKVSGKTWEDLIRERLFTPLGMKSVGFGPASTPGRVDQPWGHKKVLGILMAMRGDNPAYLGPAGTVHCSLEDYVKFVVLHLQKSRFLKPSTFEQLHKPLPGDDYAFGWMALERSWAGGLALTHSGSNTMNYFTTWLAPAKEFAVIVATNYGNDDAGKHLDSIIGDLIRTHNK